MSREMKDSGVEWIGKIPENWDTIPLKRLSKIQTGSSPDKKEGNNNYSDESGIPWIKAENLGEFFPIHSTSEYLTENGCKLGRIYPPYTVYVCCIASIGKVGFSDIECSCNQQINGLSFNNIVNWKFGFYETLASAIEHIARSNKSVTPILNATEEGKIKFAIPSPTEQQQIVHFLDRKCTAIDTAIEKTKKSIEKLEEYKKAVITKAVTKGIDPNAKMKDSGVEWCPQIPEHWSVVNPKALFSQRTERILPGDKQLTASQEHGIIYQDEYTKATGSRVVAVIRDFSILKHVEPNDFVISMRSFQGGLEYSEKRGCISSAYVMLIPNTKYVYPPFYRWFFKSSKYINALQSTSNFVRDGQAMRYSHFIQIPLFVIPLTEQKQIANYLESNVNAIMVLIQKKQMAIAKWEEYKKSLIYYAVTGKIDCRGEEL